MRILLIVGLYVGLVGYCVTDVLNQPTREPFGLRRWLWIVLIVILPYVGAAIWLLLKFRAGGSTTGKGDPRPPDDDPEYLRWLEQQSRRRRRGRPEGS